jgi:hypothetical protein
MRLFIPMMLSLAAVAEGYDFSEFTSVVMDTPPDAPNITMHFKVNLNPFSFTSPYAQLLPARPTVMRIVIHHVLLIDT